MSDRAKKKEKHRLKRLAKQKQARKKGELSPLREIINFGGKLECWINSNWQAQGMINLLVFGTADSGRNALSAFMIDAWCVGLKDAWGRTQLMRLDFSDLLKKARQGMPMRECSVEEARRLVAGAVRFSRQNGFKLPNDWTKWAEMLGSFDFESADLTDFGKDGGLLYVGDMPFLRKRLKGSTPEQFIARPDVHFVMGMDDGMIEEFDEDDEDELDDEEEFIDSHNDEDEDAEDTEESFAEFMRLSEAAVDAIEPDVLAMIEKARNEIPLDYARRGETLPARLDEAMALMIVFSMTRIAMEKVGGPSPDLADWRNATGLFLRKNRVANAGEILEICERIAPAFAFDMPVFSVPQEPILPAVLPPGV